LPSAPAPPPSPPCRIITNTSGTTTFGVLDIANSGYLQSPIKIRLATDGYCQTLQGVVANTGYGPGILSLNPAVYGTSWAGFFPAEAPPRWLPGSYQLKIFDQNMKLVPVRSPATNSITLVIS
jgi:hypothetical protein